MAYKSTRLLVEALRKEMEELRKLMMSAPPIDGVTDDGQSAIETVNVLRGMFDELAAFADRPTIEDVQNMLPTDYVAAMKPLVRGYHQRLFTIDALAPCLCEDLQASGCLLFLLGDGKIVVRSAHDPNQPQVGLAIEALVASMDADTKRLADDVADAAKQLAKQKALADRVAAAGDDYAPCECQREGDPCADPTCFNHKDPT